MRFTFDTRWSAEPPFAKCTGHKKSEKKCAGRVGAWMRER